MHEMQHYFAVPEVMADDKDEKNVKSNYCCHNEAHSTKCFCHRTLFTDEPSVLVTRSVSRREIPGAAKIICVRGIKMGVLGLSVSQHPLKHLNETLYQFIHPRVVNRGCQVLYPQQGAWFPKEPWSEALTLSSQDHPFSWASAECCVGALRCCDLFPAALCSLCCSESPDCWIPLPQIFVGCHSGVPGCQNLCPSLTHCSIFLPALPQSSLQALSIS